MTAPYLSGLDSIKQLVEASFREVESAPRQHLVGTDGAGWFQQVGHDHDSCANRSSLEELRNRIRTRIKTLIDSPGAKHQRELLRKLELAVIKSDRALLETAELVGIKPRWGLYKRIEEIVVEAERMMLPGSRPIQIKAEPARRKAASDSCKGS